MPPHAPDIIFGLNPIWVATVLLALTYVLIITERLNRSIIALLGGGVMIISGVLSQDEAIAGIDFNTIALLTGMMLLVSISRRCGMFEYLAIWSAKKGRAQPWAMLLILSLTTAVLSAFLDNVTTVLLIAPVILVVMAVQLLATHLIWGRAMQATDAARARVMALDERATITDWKLLRS